MKTILLTGATGQLGQAILKNRPNKFNIISPNREILDMSKPELCRKYVEDLSPDFIINCGAYTHVDNAEKNYDLASKINATTPKEFSEFLSSSGGKLLHISTDFVFDGEQNKPYKDNQKTSPISVYGKTKELGEIAIAEVMRESGQYLILRTSWLMSAIGNNFALKILDLHKKGKEIKVVSDQIGSPTSTTTLAIACWKVLEIWMNNQNNITLPETLHWSDRGIASWYEIALAVGIISSNLGIISKPSFVKAIKTSEFPSIVKRPRYSVLDSSRTRKLLDYSGLEWKESLKQILISLK